MENNKGITLVSLIGYVILSMLVISILTVITRSEERRVGKECTG